METTTFILEYTGNLLDLNKSELVDVLNNSGIQASDSDTKDDLSEKIANGIKDNQLFVDNLSEYLNEKAIMVMGGSQDTAKRFFGASNGDQIQYNGVTYLFDSTFNSYESTNGDNSYIDMNGNVFNAANVQIGTASTGTYSFWNNSKIGHSVKGLVDNGNLKTVLSSGLAVISASLNKGASILGIKNQISGAGNNTASVTSGTVKPSANYLILIILLLVVGLVAFKMFKKESNG